MELLNGSIVEVRQMCDGMVYVIEPFSVISVGEEAGRFLAAKCKRVGVRPVKFGDDPDEAKLACMREAAGRYRHALEQHRLANERQKEMKFPPLPESKMVKESQKWLPELEKRIAKLETKVGDVEMEAHIQTMKDLDESEVEMPEIEDMSIEQLREAARAMEVDFKPTWQRSRFIKAIQAAREGATPAPA